MSLNPVIPNVYTIVRNLQTLHRIPYSNNLAFSEANSFLFPDTTATIVFIYILHLFSPDSRSGLLFCTLLTAKLMF
jgi:hypothetical protein